MKIYQIEFLDYEAHGNCGLFTDKGVAEKIAENMNKLEKVPYHYEVIEHELDPDYGTLASDTPMALWEVNRNFAGQLKVHFDGYEQDFYDPEGRNDDPLNAYSYHVWASSAEEAKKIAGPILKKRRQNELAHYREEEERYERHLKHQ